MQQPRVDINMPELPRLDKQRPEYFIAKRVLICRPYHSQIHVIFFFLPANSCLARGGVTPEVLARGEGLGLEDIFSDPVSDVCRS